MNTDDYNAAMKDEKLSKLLDNIPEKVFPCPLVPKGYVMHCDTGTIYKLSTWLKMVEEKRVKVEDGIEST